MDTENLEHLNIAFEALETICEKFNKEGYYWRLTLAIAYDVKSDMTFVRSAVQSMELDIIKELNSKSAVGEFIAMAKEIKDEFEDIITEMNHSRKLKRKTLIRLSNVLKTENYAKVKAFLSSFTRDS